jgi:hypothetical protein
MARWVASKASLGVLLSPPLVVNKYPRSGSRRHFVRERCSGPSRQPAVSCRVTTRWQTLYHKTGPEANCGPLLINRREGRTLAPRQTAA